MTATTRCCPGCGAEHDTAPCAADAALCDCCEAINATAPPMPYYADDGVTLYHGDALAVLRTLPDASVDCCVTSPPYYGLRDYGEPGQYGLEASPAEYVDTLRAVFAEVRRVLVDDGTLWLNLGDSYVTHDPGGWRQGEHLNPGGRQAAKGSGRNRAGTQAPGIKPKNMLGIPWRVAFALQDDGWTLRNDVIWHKPNAMPESVTDRLSSRHEHVFMFSKARRYWFDVDAIREPRAESTEQRYRYAYQADGSPASKTNHLTSGGMIDRASPLGRNPGDVWTIPTSPFPGAHFATMPPEVARRCVAASCKPAGTVLDPFNGAGTTGAAAAAQGRRYVGIDLSAAYLDLALTTRLAQTALVGEAVQ